MACTVPTQKHPAQSVFSQYGIWLYRGLSPAHLTGRDAQRSREPSALFCEGMPCTKNGVPDKTIHYSELDDIMYSNLVCKIHYALTLKGPPNDPLPSRSLTSSEHI